MKKRIYAFWSNLIFGIILTCSFGCFVILLIYFESIREHIALIVVLFPIIFSIIFIINLKYLEFNFGGGSISYWALNVGNNQTMNLNEWNRNVFLSEVENIQIIKLMKDERKKYLGSKRISHKYLKFNIVYNKQKYIPISTFSKKQVITILKYIQEINPKIRIKSSK